MNKTKGPQLAMVLDEATQQKIASLYKAIEECSDRLTLQGVQSDDEASAHLCEEMVQQSSLARDLILRQPPKELLGYLWSRHYLSVLQEKRIQGENYRLDKNMIDEFQFILEFVHAAWSCCAKIAEGRDKLDEDEVGNSNDVDGASEYSDAVLSGEIEGDRG